MRWQNPKPGETRVIKKFLWLPVTLDDETRWLETAEIKQVYVAFYDGGNLWEDVCFNDKAALHYKEEI
jgi:hypothetical protein